MRVYIGPYREWIGPYQIADWLRFFGVSEDRRDKIGERLAASWVNSACEWVHKRCRRKINVRIDHYDTWSMDHTLAQIVLPMLVQLQKTKQGSPFVDDTDVPPDIRSTAAKPKDEPWDIDEFHHDRWNYVLEEIIFAFEKIADFDDWRQPFYKSKDFAAMDLIDARIVNGTRLFGLYFQALWD
jgi:hypothetical protein